VISTDAKGKRTKGFQGHFAQNKKEREGLPRGRLGKVIVEPSDGLNIGNTKQHTAPQKFILQKKEHQEGGGRDYPGQSKKNFP